MTMTGALVEQGVDDATTERPASTSGFQKHIQGLRAVAVGLVIANHLLGWPSGGFIGVDVFFVISGFLITGLLLREQERSNRISLREFYARRMRRIFPMAVVVLMCTVAVGFAVLTVKRADATLVDAIWAFFSLENWHLAWQGTDYFHGTDAVSPVQQYWSLSVEEQFYLVWPLLMMALATLAARIVRRRARHSAATRSADGDQSRRALAIGLAVIVVVSFIWAVVQSTASPTVAYFSTFTRAWELAVGALLAVTLTKVRLVPRARGILLAAALAAIAVSAVWITTDTSFPGPWAAVPVAATALALAVGGGAGGPAAAVLRSGPFQYVGNLSYSLYLWHFPVFIFTFTLLDRTPSTMVLALAIAVGLSMAGYYLIEDPVRRSRWLSRRRRQQPEALPAARNGWGTAAHVGRWMALTAGAIAVLGVTAYGLYPRLVAAATPHSTPTTLAELTSGTLAQATINPESVLKLSLRDAVEATEFPTFNEADGWAELRALTSGPECQAGPNESAKCDFIVPGATKNAIVIGDSQTQAWLTGLKAALLDQGYSIHLREMPGCTIADSAINQAFSDHVPHTECPPFRQQYLDEIREKKPDVVIASSLWMEFRMAPGADSNPDSRPTQEWQDALQRTVDEVAASTPRVVLLDSPPEGQSIVNCQTATATPADCQTQVTQAYRDITEMNEAVTAQERTAGRDVRHIAVEDWFCWEGTCPAFIAAHPIYADQLHVAPVYGEFVAPLLRQRILR